MIAYRFQAWKISASRAGEFRRTRRPGRLPRAMLVTRWINGDSEMRVIGLRLELPDRHRAPREKRLARPAARTSPYPRSGPMRCVAPWDSWDRVEYYPATPPKHRRRAGLPPASVAAHRLAAFGCAPFPF